MKLADEIRNLRNPSLAEHRRQLTTYKESLEFRFVKDYVVCKITDVACKLEGSCTLSSDEYNEKLKVSVQNYSTLNVDTVDVLIHEWLDDEGFDVNWWVADRMVIW